MLWSLIKILLFVAAVAGLAYGATWLLDAEGGVQITVANTEFTLGALQSAIALLLLVVALYVVLKLVSLLVATLRFINGDETAISRYFTRNREKKGLRAVSDSLMALAAGDGQAAISSARQAAQVSRQARTDQHPHRPGRGSRGRCEGRRGDLQEARQPRSAPASSVCAESSSRSSPRAIPTPP